MWGWDRHGLQAVEAADFQADANARPYAGVVLSIQLAWFLSSQTRDRLKSANVPVVQMIAFTDQLSSLKSQTAKNTDWFQILKRKYFQDS